MHLDSLPDITASVWSGGAELKEYDDIHEEENQQPFPGPFPTITARKYIEAIDGANFEVRVELLPTYTFERDALCAKVYVDGLLIRSPLLTKVHFKAHTLGLQVESESGPTTLRKFSFNRIETTEDQESTDKVDDVDKIGEIKVELYRMQTGPKISYTSKSVETKTIEKVSEKQTKGRVVSHGTTYGPEEPTVKPVYWDSKYVDGKDKPFAVFKLLYRSRAALQTMLIIPRTPSPAPPSPLSNRTNANAKSSSSQKDAKVKLEKRIKRELDEGSQSGTRKKRRSGSGMIDLTEEDDENEAKAVVFKRFRTDDGQEGIDLT